MNDIHRYNYIITDMRLYMHYNIKHILIKQYYSHYKGP